MSLSPGRFSIRRHLIRMLDDGSGRIDSDEAVAGVLDLLTEEEERALLREAVARLVRAELAALVHERRREGTAFAFSGGIIDGDALNQSARELASRIFENLDGTTVRMTIITMTRPDLAASISFRERQIAGHLRFVAVETELMNRLPNDAVTVGEFFSDRELDLIWWSFFGRPNR